LKNGRAIGYNSAIFANHDRWGAVDDRGAESPTGRIVLRVLARTSRAAEHLLRSIDRFVELDGVRRELAPFYSEAGRPSIDPELMIRMLIVGYCFGIRSERRLCEEVHLNLA
jgi:transposase